VDSPGDSCLGYPSLLNHFNYLIMSNSLIQLEIDTAIKAKQEQDLKDKQASCQHVLVEVPLFDFEHDDVIYISACVRCGLRTE